MSNEEIIKVLEQERACVARQGEGGCDRDCARCDLLMDDKVILEAYDAAIALLDAQPNEPFTLEELRGMYGKPVWVEYEDGKDGRWGLVGIGEITFPAGEFCVICEDGFGQSWKAYLRPPKEA